MFKILTLLIIPFFIFACDKDAEEGLSSLVKKFQSNENKEFFLDANNGKVDSYSYLKFIADPDNNNVTMIERVRNDRGAYDLKRRALFICDESQCITNTFNNEYESIVINITSDFTEVLLSRFEVKNNEDRLLTQQRYLSIEEVDEE